MQHSPAAPDLLVWCEMTARQPFITGVQRVVRRLGTELQAMGWPVATVGWNNARRVLTGLTAADGQALGFGRTGFGDVRAAGAGQTAWLLLPETPGVVREKLSPVAVGHAYGLKVAAIVHDLIPVKLGAFYTEADRVFYADYFRMIAAADLVVTTTPLVAEDFRAFLSAQGLAAPPMALVPLGGDFAGPPTRPVRAARPDDGPLALLMIGSWEARKNHPRVLRALHRAQATSPRPIELTIVGRRAIDPAYDQDVLACLQTVTGAVARPWMQDADLAALYRRSDATVYGSFEEGFGLPVMESLWMGAPCLCHAGSAMASVAPGGGTLAVDMLDEASITAGLLQLAQPDGTLQRLTGEAAARPIRTWRDTAQDLAAALTQAG